ncbi:MAG TPA: TlpA disulfide reductase family protein [Mycobacteriales bacterium]|nr:TlpA disulfide reductase family protein [Mycobacteriales bacterium]
MSPGRLGAALVLAASLVACTSGGGTTPDPLESVALRPIATDDCPAAAELLTAEQVAAASGDRLPDVTLPCIGSDRTVALRAIGGTPTVLNLWASWCLPCKKEMPAFQAVHNVAAGRVRFLGVNVADTSENSARGTIQETGIAYASVRAEGRDLLRALSVPGPPMTLFVDARGSLVHRAVGELTADELRGLIREHLSVDLPAPA